jgi:hypothetical protein
MFMFKTVSRREFLGSAGTMVDASVQGCAPNLILRPNFLKSG